MRRPPRSEWSLWWVQRGYKATVVEAADPQHAAELAARPLAPRGGWPGSDRLTVRPATLADRALVTDAAAGPLWVQLAEPEGEQLAMAVG